MKHSPAIEIAALKQELRNHDQECAHWDYEDEYPDCVHAPRRDYIRQRIAVLRKRINKET